MILRRYLRFSHFSWKFLSLKQCDYSSISANNLTYLCEYLNIDENQAHYLQHKYPLLRKLNKTRIITVIETVEDLGLKPGVLVSNPALFGILPITLRFRYKVLQESGIQKLTPTLLLSYLTVIKQKTVGELKRDGLIDDYVNVENRLASYMTQWPTSLTTLVYGDVNKSTIYMLRLKIIQRYLELTLDVTTDEFYRGLYTYPTIKHRPLEIINETLNILKCQIFMPSYKIKSNLYLIHLDPENLKNIVYKFKSIGGIDIKEIIRLHPKIATNSYSALLEMRKVLEEFNVSNEAQIRCFEIYTLSPATVRERLERAKAIPEFYTFFNHPRFLRMIYYNNTVMKRLRKLYTSNKKCLSLNILSGSSASYEAFEKAPGDRLGKSKDLVFCISQYLGNTFSTSDIRKLIRRHPFWINIPLVQIKFVYEQLSNQFSPKDIFENCIILLYPWNKIRNTITTLEKKEIKLSFSYEHFDFEKLSKSQKLSLVLYLLEKHHYFTGNGVWTEEKYKNNPELSSHIKESLVN